MKAGFLEHFKLAQGLFDQGGGLRVCGGGSTNWQVLEHIELHWGSFNQAGGLRVFRSCSEVVRPQQGLRVRELNQVDWRYFPFPIDCLDRLNQKKIFLLIVVSALIELVALIVLVALK